MATTAEVFGSLGHNEPGVCVVCGNEATCKYESKVCTSHCGCEKVCQPQPHDKCKHGMPLDGACDDCYDEYYHVNS
jgi:hypothetical protein